MVIVAFIHPDLGIGGAERLVCDAALALKKQGHIVQIFTSHHDPKHCFNETIDGTLSVKAVADWLPRQTFGRFYAFWAYVRMITVALYLIFLSDYKPDIFICDQISACIPILKLNRQARIIFYCHYPDMLLTKRETLIKKLYRFPIDWLEEFTTGLADTVLVNSNFTSETFHRSFTTLFSIQPKVLYPSLNFESFKQMDTQKRKELIEAYLPPGKEFIFLSINRYERKKNLALCINALKELKKLCLLKIWKKVHLIIAGGYDERVTENKEHYLELRELAVSSGVSENITFVCSITDEQKVALLQTATCLIYTPSNEHFGIVPIEAMYMKCPVIACNSGGPKETVLHKVTGYLCEPKPEHFANSLMTFINGDKITTTMGENGYDRVIKNFSFDAFTSKLDSLIKELSDKKLDRNESWSVTLFVFFLVLLCIIRWLFL
ncbi:alpha-1,3/1,6-mannosyltransferase ALG2 isoform X2 [Hydra vulgaris]|uniref:Alpha-1,3/1,6-mannosyltransferase ALG2 n=1 Tax=Hydra vulgaris TaxID=6087 RepID=A0ABM4C7D6_HYDVU